MNKIKKSGFSVIETIVAMAIFIVFVSSGIFSVLGSLNLNRLGQENTQALLLAQEGVDATRSIKKQAWSNLVAGPHGIGVSNSLWKFIGTSEVTDKYTRTIGITQAFRDTNGTLVSSGGTVDPDTFLVSSDVTWDFSPTRNNSVGITSYLTNWEKSIISGTSPGGILVYGNGSTNTDNIAYKTLAPNGTWGVASSMADVDTGSTNKALRAIRVFASSTRNEKIAISRHRNSTTQYIYMQVFDGTNWGNVQVGASWATTTYTDVVNFDGTYLANGDFVALYSDNTTTPKFRVWKGGVGATWSAQIATQVIGGIPSFITAKARPGTNEIMAVFFDQSSDTNSEYFNGGAYQASSWTVHTEHSATAPSAAKWMADFTWSPNTTTKGVIIFPTSTTDKTLTSKVWTANGSGGGSWSGTVADSPASAGNMGAMSIEGRAGADHFLACQKDANSDLYCFKYDIGSSWSSPANNILTTTNYSGNPRSFQIGYEKSGSLGLVTYSDNTSTPKYRKYDPSANAFDAAASGLSATTGTIATVRQIPSSANDDIMVLMANTAFDVYSAVWDGNSSAFYSSGGNAQTQHGVNGPVATDFWYDYAWNAY